MHYIHLPIHRRSDEASRHHHYGLAAVAPLYLQPCRCHFDDGTPYWTECRTYWPVFVVDPTAQTLAAAADGHHHHHRLRTGAKMTYCALDFGSSWTTDVWRHRCCRCQPVFAIAYCFVHDRDEVTSKSSVDRQRSTCFHRSVRCWAAADTADTDSETDALVWS